MIKHLKLVMVGLALALVGISQPLTNYSTVQWDSGPSTPLYCTIPGFFLNTNTGTFYTCNTSHVFVSTGGNGASGNVSSFGTYAALPTSCVTKGDSYKATDSQYSFLCGANAGTYNQVFYDQYPVTIAPLVSALTWVNQGDASATNAGGLLVITGSGTNATDIRPLVHAMPTPPYTITIGFKFAHNENSDGSCGLVVGDTVDGTYSTFGEHIGSGAFDLFLTNWNSPTSVNGDVKTWAYATIPPFLQMVDDGTNFTFKLSFDGQNFTTFDSVGRTSFLNTPSVIGVNCSGFGGNVGIGSFFSWVD
jgi:hypothetical protein